MNLLCSRCSDLQFDVFFLPVLFRYMLYVLYTLLPNLLFPLCNGLLHGELVCDGYMLGRRLCEKAIPSEDESRSLADAGERA